eukprot:2647180-Amphidinium_carterae.1
MDLIKEREELAQKKLKKKMRGGNKVTRDIKSQSVPKEVKQNEWDLRSEIVIVRKCDASRCFKEPRHCIAFGFTST